MKTQSGKNIMGMSLILSALAATTNSASSDAQAPAPPPLLQLDHALSQGFEDCRRVSADELDDMRGGFLTTVDGLQFLLSLGIERVTYVNGALVATSTFNFLPQLNSSQTRQSLASQTSQMSAGNMQRVPSTALPATADIRPTAGPSPDQKSAAPAPASAPVAPASPSPPVAAVTAFTPTPSAASAAPMSAAPPVASAASNSPPAPSTASAAPIAAQNAPPTHSTPAPSTRNYQPIQVVQIGPRNTFTLPSNLPAGTMSVIQNTLDNQLIRNMTTINATLATRELLRSTALSTALSRIPANFGR